MTTDNRPWRNRKERKEWARRLQSEDPGLEVVHPQAAGIDIGNGAHYVAVRPDRDPEPVQRFECFTADLHRLADWLRSCDVKTVAPPIRAKYSNLSWRLERMDGRYNSGMLKSFNEVNAAF
jgi:hypothetical protein